MKTKSIDHYICLDINQIVLDEMRDIINQEENSLHPDDVAYWARAKDAAKVIFDVYWCPDYER